MAKVRSEDSEAGGRAAKTVVGIGASAGGIEACRQLLAQVPAQTGMAFVVILHLDPTRESHIAEILARDTPMSVAQVSRDTRIEADTVYVIAPAASLRVEDGVLRPGEPSEPRFHRKPVDDFFSSLARAYGEGAVGIVLSGAGDDGASGLRDIKDAGGLCLVQDPASSEYDSMPKSAIATGAADAVLSPENMPPVLSRLGRRGEAAVRPADERPEALDEVLALLGERHGLDFRSYKIGTLRRRTERRMALRQIGTWPDYLAYLREHPDELSALYRDLLIGVTRFFRDPQSWRYLEGNLVPEILSRQSEDEPIRVWTVGCATGEEAYSLAMVFFEAFERMKQSPRLQIYATDVSREALEVARRGRYPQSVADDLAPARVRRFFEREHDQLRVVQRLRDAITFAPHNLLADPPFSRMDLATCRNVLIYLEPHAQSEALELLHFSLRSDGLLWLGSSETVGRNSDLFEQVSAGHRIYRAVQVARAHKFSMPRRSMRQIPAPGPAASPTVPARGHKVSRLLEQYVLNRYAPASVAVNQNLDILHFFGPTERYLSQPRGEARLDLLSWLRPGLYSRVRSALREAIEQMRTVEVPDMRLGGDEDRRRVRCAIEPITSLPGVAGALLVRFEEAGPPAAEIETRESEAPADGALISQLEDELRHTRQELQSAVAELEGVSEEYRASHEELLSLNEELKSSNEELETSKEELQSLNEELVTVNRQLEDKNAELYDLNADLKNLIVSTGVPTVFLDRGLRIRRFTRAATDVMRVAAADIGRSLEDIRLLVPDDRLLSDIHEVLAHLAPIEAEIGSQGSGWYIRSVTPYRTEDERIDGVCITFHDITAQKRAADESQEARLYAEAIVRASRTSFLVLDDDARIVSANEAFFETFQVSREETIGRELFELGNGQWDIARLRALLRDLRREGSEEVRDYDVEHSFETLGWRFMRLNATRMTRPSRPSLILLAIEDLTDLRLAEMAAASRADKLADEHRRKDEFLAMLGHELRNPLAALANGLDLLRMKRPDAERAVRIIEMMNRQTRRITSMLDQLLDIARVISGKITLANEVVDVAYAVRAACETLAPRIEEERHELCVSLPEDEGRLRVRGDPMRVAQIVENLLDNAVKYTEPRGRIWVTADTEGDWVRIAVRDTGIGIGKATLASIFDLFTQDARGKNRTRGGLGLGLPLVRNLAELHGGTARAVSEGEGRGTEIIVSLPRIEAGAEEVGGVAVARQGGDGSPAMRVLVVEDEPDAAETLSGVLEHQGHQVEVAADGASALESARTRSFDVVLADLNLPDIDGYEVARKLRDEHGEGIRLFAVTGYPMDQERLERAGFEGHLLKPVDPDTLAERLAVRAEPGAGVRRKSLADPGSPD